MGGHKLTYAEMLHLIAYMRRMIEQMLVFLDEAEKKIPVEDVHKSDMGSWP